MTVLELQTRRAPFAPSTWNAEARTVEAVISTGADVQRRDTRGPYIERLDLSGIDPASLVGLPVQIEHNTSTRFTVGVIASARREAGNLVSIIRFSAADDVRDTVLKVSEGCIRGVSIGYGETNIRETTEAGRRIRTVAPAIREVSVVAIPADPDSKVRNQPMTTQTTTLIRPCIPPPLLSWPVRGKCADPFDRRDRRPVANLVRCTDRR